VNELATNAVVHAGTDFLVEVCLTSASVELGISDGSRYLPVLAGAREGLGSSGLGVVDALASAWGTIETDTGKSVWVRLELPVAASSGKSAKSAMSR
jgi:two-component sensor histidine kinase